MHEPKCIHLIRTCAFSPFLTFLHEIGTPVDKLLRTCRVPRRTLEYPYGLIPAAAATLFLEKAVLAERLPTLGYLAGQGLSIDYMGSYGKQILSSLTLFQALDTAQKLISTMASSNHLWMEHHDALAWCCHRNKKNHYIGSQQGSLYSVMFIINLIRTALGDSWKPTMIHLQMPFQAEVAQIEEFGGIPLVFGQAQSAIAMPSKLLSLPLNRHGLEGLSCPDHEIKEWQLTTPALDLEGSLKQLVLAHLRDEHTSILHVAESAGTSPRTLQRQLEEKGTQYSRLVDEIRFDLAVNMLADPSVKIADITHELGYSNCANFTRAFRRWAGVSPDGFRKLRREEDVQTTMQ